MPNLLSLLGLKPLPTLETTAPDEGRHRGDDDVVVAPQASPGGGAKSGAKGSDEASPAKAGDKPGDKAAVPPEKLAYDKELAAVAKLRADLGKHAQADHVKDKTDHADAAIAAAATHAATPDWPAAMAELASAKTALVDGKSFADKFADFLGKRAEANLLLTAAQTSGWALNAWVPALLVSADGKAAPGTRDYPGAKLDCQKMVDALAPRLQEALRRRRQAADRGAQGAAGGQVHQGRDRRARQDDAAAAGRHHGQAMAPVQAQPRPGPRSHPDGAEDRRPAHRVRRRAAQGRHRPEGAGACTARRSPRPWRRSSSGSRARTRSARRRACSSRTRRTRSWRC